MGSDLNVCGNIIRVVLIIINILFVILGCILIGIGSWGIAVDSDFSFITGSSIASGAVLLIIAGIVTVIVCATGIVGAIFKLRPVLLIYAGVLAIIVILEIVGGILAFVFRNSVVGTLEEGSLNAIRLYPASVDNSNSTQRDARRAVDAVQSSLRCCGYNNARDWPNENPMVISEGNGRPPQIGGCIMCTVGPDDENCMRFTGSYNITSGSVTTTETYNFTASRVGCIQRLEDNLVLIGSVGGALGVVFGILEITGVLFALFLCCCISNAKRQEVV